jgi:hypothetical protein
MEQVNLAPKENVEVLGQKLSEFFRAQLPELSELIAEACHSSK